MTGGRRPIRDELSCGCAVEIDLAGTMHVLPCGVPQHELALTAAARDIAERLGIPMKERVPGDQ